MQTNHYSQLFYGKHCTELILCQNKRQSTNLVALL